MENNFLELVQAVVLVFGAFLSGIATTIGVLRYLKERKDEPKKINLKQVIDH